MLWRTRCVWSPDRGWWSGHPAKDGGNWSLVSWVACRRHRFFDALSVFSRHCWVIPDSAFTLVTQFDCTATTTDRTWLRLAVAGRDWQWQAVSVRFNDANWSCVLNVKYMVSDHVLLHSYPHTNSNTSTGMIWVTLNMPSAANRPGNVGEFHIVWRVVTLVIVFIYNDVVCFTIMKKQICISLQKFQKIKKKQSVALRTSH